MSNASVGETPHNSCKMRLRERRHFSGASCDRIIQNPRGVGDSTIACKVVAGWRDAKRTEKCANSSLSLRLLSPLHAQTCLHQAVSRTEPETTIAVWRENV